jgi:hypothetical protein
LAREIDAMKRWATGGSAIGVLSIAVAACTPPHPHPRPKVELKSIASLNCPETQSELTRKSVAADGQSCQYVDSAGNPITLQIIRLKDGDATAALAPLEASLRAELPAASDADGDRDSKDGGAGKSADKDRVDIDLPGIHIHANGSGDGSGDRVQIGKSVTVADGKTVVTNRQSGGAGVTVDAHDKGAEVHVSEPGGGIRQSFILASETPGPHGYRLASYEARGPASGPIVVASILSKTNDQDELHGDLGDLLKLNVGG